MPRNWRPEGIEHEPIERRMFYAHDPRTHPDTLKLLSNDPFWYVRDLVASNPSTPHDCLLKLSLEPDFRIRHDARKTLYRINAESKVPLKGNSFTQFPDNKSSLEDIIANAESTGTTPHDKTSKTKDLSIQSKERFE